MTEIAYKPSEQSEANTARIKAEWNRLSTAEQRRITHIMRRLVDVPGLGEESMIELAGKLGRMLYNAKAGRV